MDQSRTLVNAIARHASARGNAAALVGIGHPDTSFARLYASITSFASQLASAGLKREDRVGLLVPEGVPGGQLVMALACNVALVPINPALTKHELTDLVTTSGLSAMVIPAWLDTAARAALKDLRVKALEAILAPDGALGLQLLTPEAGPAVPVRPARQDDVALLLRSSGTTGAPKLIPVTHLNLVVMAEKMGSDLWFHLTAVDRAACMLPLFYAAGLKTLLLVPLILGASVAFPPAGQALSISKWIGELRPTYLTVTPGSLNGLLDRLRGSPHDFDSGSLRFVMCGSACLSEEVRMAAQSMLGVPVLDFYGLSEAGVMAANPLPPGRIKPGTVGLPAPGQLLVVDESRQPVGAGVIGEIFVGGASVMPGYAVRDGTRGVGVEDGWLATGDLGRLDDEGYLTIVGRIKEVINRGGEKVFPYEIESAMLEHPAVLEAAVFGVPHPRLGESVAAAAVLKPGSVGSEAEIKAFIARQLAGSKLPRRVHLVSSLPRGSTGKVLRRALGETYTNAHPERAPPQELIEFELRDIWTRLLGTDDIGVDDDFFEKGGDSLLATEMLIELEQLAGRPYPPSELSTFTIRHIADVVIAGKAAERDLITQVKRGTGIPFFFCHGDYVSRGLYAHKLAALLPEDQPLILLNCYADHAIGANVEEAATAYMHEVLRAAPGSPVILGGYCNGGLTAWHLAHLLRSRGVEVVELILIETLSMNVRPALRGLAPIVESAASVVPGHAGRVLRENAMMYAWILARKGFADIFPRFYRAIRKRLTPARQEEPAPGVRRDAYRAMRTYYQMMARYVPPRIDVEVTCFLAEDGDRHDNDPALWERLAPRVREVRTPGEHLTMLVAERQALATAVSESLNRATTRYRARIESSSGESASAWLDGSLGELRPVTRTSSR